MSQNIGKALAPILQLVWGSVLVVKGSNFGFVFGVTLSEICISLRPQNGAPDTTS